MKTVFVGNMKKLWQKNNDQLDQVIEAFEQRRSFIGSETANLRCYGSIAHAKMLKKIGIILAMNF